MFLAVLDLLAGRYPSDAFAELRPRLVWDRGADVVRARDGAGRIAITNGGTIPDRGLFGVFLPDGTRVGELDEEMVYESRRGEVFLLGASSWRIEDITRDRVVVVPAPGEPGKMPFWHGDKPGRPLELGRAIGAFTRELRGTGRDDALPTPARRCRPRRRGPPQNLVNYLDEQLEATGAVPDDRTVVVERFRDEIGDWRVCILSPFGSRVHTPWGLAIEARLDRAVRAGRPGAVERRRHRDPAARRRSTGSRSRTCSSIPTRSRPRSCACLPVTALFASVFREASARALLLPRQRPGKRTPLWQQRQRSADLLTEAAKHPTFPMLLETTRECLRDVFDVPALREVMSDLRSRTTQSGDGRHRARVTVRPVAALPVDRRRRCTRATPRWPNDVPPHSPSTATCCASCSVPRSCAICWTPRRRPDPARAAMARRRPAGARASTGSTTCSAPSVTCTEDEIAQRTDGDAGAVDRDPHRGRASDPVRVAGEQRVAAVDDAARLRDALGVSLAPGPARGLHRTLRSVRSRAWSRGSPGPTVRSPTTEVAERLGASAERVRSALEWLETEGTVTAGAFRPGGQRTGMV